MIIMVLRGERKSAVRHFLHFLLTMSGLNPAVTYFTQYYRFGVRHLSSYVDSKKGVTGWSRLPSTLTLAHLLEFHSRDTSAECRPNWV
jgi:hypothetical protein